MRNCTVICQSNATYMIECLLDLVVLDTLLQQNYQGMSLDMLRKRQALWVQHPVTLQFDSCLAIAYVIVNGNRSIKNDQK